MDVGMPAEQVRKKGEDGRGVGKVAGDMQYALRLNAALAATNGASATWEQLLDVPFASVEVRVECARKQQEITRPSL